MNLEISLIEENIMGGPKKRSDSINCDTLQQNVELWDLFGRVGFTPFFEATQGYNDSLTLKFTNSWFKDKVNVGGLHFTVNS